jgi:hypothetical protein
LHKRKLPKTPAGWTFWNAGGVYYDPSLFAEQP